MVDLPQFLGLNDGRHANFYYYMSNAGRRTRHRTRQEVAVMGFEL